MKTLLPAALACLLALTGCAGHPARTFTPTDTGAIAGAVASTHEEIKKADQQAAVIERTGTTKGSKEITELRLTLRTAEADALAAKTALENFKLTDSRKFDEINKEIKTQTARAEHDEAKVANIKPHLMRLRYLAGIGVILGAAAYGLAPLAKSSPYLTLVPSIVLSLAAVAVTLGLLAAFITLAALFGWL